MLTNMLTLAIEVFGDRDLAGMPFRACQYFKRPFLRGLFRWIGFVLFLIVFFNTFMLWRTMWVRCLWRKICHVEKFSPHDKLSVGEMSPQGKYGEKSVLWINVKTDLSCGEISSHEKCGDKYVLWQFMLFFFLREICFFSGGKRTNIRYAAVLVTTSLTDNFAIVILLFFRFLSNLFTMA